MRSAVGFLTVHVSEAQGLVGFHSKLPNAFAVLHFGDLEFCTIVKKGTATPKWDKEFIVYVLPPFSRHTPLPKSRHKCTKTPKIARQERFP